MGHTTSHEQARSEVEHTALVSHCVTSVDVCTRALDESKLSVFHSYNNLDAEQEEDISCPQLPRLLQLSQHRTVDHLRSPATTSFSFACTSSCPMSRVQYPDGPGKRTTTNAPHARHIDTMGAATLPYQIVQGESQRYSHQAWLSNETLQALQEAFGSGSLGLNHSGVWVPLVPSIDGKREFGSPNELDGMQVDQSTKPVSVRRKDRQPLHFYVQKRTEGDGGGWFVVVSMTGVPFGAKAIIS